MFEDGPPLLTDPLASSAQVRGSDKNKGESMSAKASSSGVISEQVEMKQHVGIQASGKRRPWEKK